ncbi:MAG: type II secretion system protein [Chloroflexi bacterium]|nr:type II secretion system protein [Chloroflexota bacterium]
MYRLERQQGFSLVETLIALGILGMIGIAFLHALGAGTLATGILDEQVQAAALARSQLEEIKSTPYNALCDPLNCYLVTVTVPAPYSISIRAEPVNIALCEGISNCVQRVTVSISRPGKPVLNLTTYRKQ